jgi:hypothetical protein
MQITHGQARKLIQFSLDGILPVAEKATLSAHLQNCADCRDYADELKEIETIMLPVMKKQWSARPIPLSIPWLVQSQSPRINNRLLLTMRSAAIGLVFVALFFSTWKFVSTSPSMSSPMPLVVPQVPTPQTAQSTNTEITFESCETMVYRVQEGDTLASIANRFLVPADEIMEINQLKTEAVSVSMELMIPVCNFTPTGTIHPVTFTTTYTPIMHPTTSTPAGRY